MNLKSVLWISITLVLTACNATKKTVSVYEPSPDAVPLEEEILTEQRQLDTMVISAPRIEEELLSKPEVF